MLSTIGWVDFSSVERERVAQVLALLKEKGTLDELGIGQVRDAFADVLFPGFSTIQTRAKYFITIPRFFHDYNQLEARVKKRTKLEEYISNREDELAKLLVAKHSADEKGIIGRESLEKGVARKPSSVYWNGLRKLKIVNSNVSLKEFTQQFYNASIESHAHHSSEEDDSDAHTHKRLLDKDTGYSQNWLDEIDINLTNTEASYLKSKIIHSTLIENSVPAQVIINDLLEPLLELDQQTVNSEETIWHFGLLTDWLQNTKISDACKNNLKMANEFSLSMEGAHIRYNYLIALRAENKQLEELSTNRFEQWQQRVSSLPESIFSEERSNYWLTSAFANSNRIKGKTKRFIENWNHLIFTKAPLNELDKFVEMQARENKKERCLLNKALASDQGWVGMTALEYRWPNVSTILKDISIGLKR